MVIPAGCKENFYCKFNSSDISLKKLTWVLFELLVTSPIATPDAISVNCTPASENMKKKMKYFLQQGKYTESCAEYTPFEMFIILKKITS